jgi:hypothetical protein
LCPLEVVEPLVSLFDPVCTTHAVNDELFHQFKRQSSPLVFLQALIIGIQLSLAYDDEMVSAERAVIYEFEGAFGTLIHTAFYLFNVQVPFFFCLQWFFKLEAMKWTRESELCV